MHAQCIDLKERFGKRFRVAYEESYRASYGLHASRKDPWFQVLLCRYGHIYPFGGERLAASVDGHPNVAGVLRRLPCCRVQQNGDSGELTVVFNVADFAKVAKAMRPRRRRQPNLTPEQKESIARRLAQARNDTPEAVVQDDPTARHGVPTCLVEPKPSQSQTPSPTLRTRADQWHIALEGIGGIKRLGRAEKRLASRQGRIGPRRLRPPPARSFSMKMFGWGDMFMCDGNGGPGGEGVPRTHTLPLPGD